MRSALSSQPWPRSTGLLLHPGLSQSPAGTTATLNLPRYVTAVSSRVAARQSATLQVRTPGDAWARATVCSSAGPPRPAKALNSQKLIL